MKITLVIATYNWPEALNLVLKSVLKQSIMPNEIIIADDGSTKRTKILIDSYSKRNMLNIHHIWHKDNGFQKTIIMNKAISKAEGDYIVQIDGDIILHNDFIKDHIINAKKYRYIHGGRVLLNKITTEKYCNSQNINFSIFQQGIANRLNMIHSKILSDIFSRSNNNIEGTRGCNFSFWKNDFLSVNGYNEDMIGWGKEDTELSVRLINQGLQKYQLKFNAICYHLYHKKSSFEKLNINNEILKTTINNRLMICNNGINKYGDRDS